MPRRTSSDLLALIAPGAQVVVRDEQWVVRSTQQTPADGMLVRCIRTSTLVKDTEATFVTNLDRVEPLHPEDTVLVADDSPNQPRQRVPVEAVSAAEVVQHPRLGPSGVPGSYSLCANATYRTRLPSLRGSADPRSALTALTSTFAVPHAQKRPPTAELRIMTA